MDSLFDCGVVVCDGIGGLLDCLDCISGFDLDIEGPVHELGVLVDVPDDGHVFIVVECLDKGGDEGQVGVFESEGDRVLGLLDKIGLHGADYEFPIINIYAREYSRDVPIPHALIDTLIRSEYRTRMCDCNRVFNITFITKSDYYIDSPIHRKVRRMDSYDDGFKRLFGKMDGFTMNLFLDRLIAEFGEERLKELAEDLTSEQIVIDRTSIVTRARDASEDPLGIALEVDNYEDLEDKAFDMMFDNLYSEFRDDIEALNRLGRHEDVREYVSAIIEGLNESEGLLVELSPHSHKMLAHRLKECLENDCVMDFFDGL